MIHQHTTSPRSGKPQLKALAVLLSTGAFMSCLIPASDAKNGASAHACAGLSEALRSDSLQLAHDEGLSAETACTIGAASSVFAAQTSAMRDQYPDRFVDAFFNAAAPTQSVVYLRPTTNVDTLPLTVGTVTYVDAPTLNSRLTRTASIANQLYQNLANRTIEVSIDPLTGAVNEAK